MRHAELRLAPETVAGFFAGAGWVERRRDQPALIVIPAEPRPISGLSRVGPSDFLMRKTIGAWRAMCPARNGMSHALDLSLI
jgi:hypothetical protein